MRKPSGFTLIELLIVVAIIAILAAIAVPNFLEAQTRSKISRTMADMRSLATALESYSVDYNKYPSGLDPNFGALVVVHKSYLRRLTSLTTPLAYMTSIPDDVFNLFGETSPIREYKTFDYTLKDEVLRMTTNWHNDWKDQQGRLLEGKYIMRGYGPDKDNDRLSGQAFGIGVIPYDATNGTVSNGDLKYVGPSLGFGR